MYLDDIWELDVGRLSYTHTITSDGLDLAIPEGGQAFATMDVNRTGVKVRSGIWGQGVGLVTRGSITRLHRLYCPCFHSPRSPRSPRFLPCELSPL